MPIPFRQANVFFLIVGILAATFVSGCSFRGKGQKAASSGTSEQIESESDDESSDEEVVPKMGNQTPLQRIPSQTAEFRVKGLDPNSVGWTSEAFNDSTLKQLKLLVELFQHPRSETDKKFLNLLTEDFSCSRLRPQSLELVRDDRKSSVSRAAAPVSQGEYDRSKLLQLSKALPQTTRPEHHVAVKNVHIDLTDNPSTQSRVSGFGVKDGQPTEWVATWDCKWDTSDSTPRLHSLRVASYEEVTVAKGASTFLVDQTATVMGSAEGYRDQLLVGMNTWVNRLEDRLRVNRLGHNGIAIGDVNGDGRDDIYVCQPGGLPNRLYVGQPDGTVRDTSKKAGVDFLDDTTCALLIDLDNDGDQDLAMITVAAAVVLSNDAKGRFTPKAVIADCRNSFSMTATDFNGDRLLDLYVGRYWASDVARGEHPLPIPYYDANNGGRNVLLQNKGDWQFEDVTESAGLNTNNSRFTMAAAWEDLDNDGDSDLYVANDFGRNCLYRNDGGVFVDVAAEADVEDIASGMSVSFGDYDHNGQFDIYVSNMFSTAGQRTTAQSQYTRSFQQNDLSKLRRLARGNTLFKKNADDTFSDVSLDANVTMGRWAWGALFADIDNDSWDDLLVANGFLTSSDTGDM